MGEQVDELFDVKSAFYIGAFQQCIKNCQTARLSDPALAVEKDGFMYRSYLAQGKYAVIMDEIKPSAPRSLQHLRTLAGYLQSSPESDSRAEAVRKIEDALNSGTGEDNLCVAVAATIYMHEKNYDSALRALNGPAASQSNLEVLAMQVQAYLMLDRLDFAKKSLKQMQDIDDDSVLTQVAQAWCNIVIQGGEKSKDAYFAFQELADKSKSTPLLLNGQVCAFLAQGMMVEAEAALNEAMDIDSNNYDTLVNQVVFNQLNGKEATRLVTQLKDKEQSNFVTEYKQKEADFERLCQNYRPSA